MSAVWYDSLCNGDGLYGIDSLILVDGSEKCGIREPQGRKNLVKRLVIITIVLINCIFELKILKFF